MDPSESGLIGAGQPVKTAVTVGGETRMPGVLDATISLVGAREAKFLRGNANNDGKVDIGDAIWIINELFREGPATVCRDAADVNNDGSIDATDVVALVAYQFEGGSPPPAPGPTDCGTDPEGEDDGLACTESQVGC
jgi:hypothetical protein